MDILFKVVDVTSETEAVLGGGISGYQIWSCCLYSFFADHKSTPEAEYGLGSFATEGLKSFRILLSLF